MGHAGAIKCLALLLLCIHRSAGQGPSDMIALVRNDVQRMATDIHVALGLERPATPPMPLLPPPVVPVTTQAPITTLALPTTSMFPMSSTSAPLTTDWPSTSLPPPSTSTTAAPTSTMQPPVSTTTMAQSTSSAPPSSTSTAQPTTTQAPTTTTAALTTSTAQPTSTQAPTTTAAVPTTSTAVPTTTAAPTTSTATPTSTMAPTTTSAVTTSTAPTTTAQTTVTPGACTSPATLTFSGSSGAFVGIQGPFNFSGWTYDSGSSSPPTYTQAILNQQSSTQVIGVTAANGVLICGIAASGTNAATNATFYGYTMVETTVSKSALLPSYNAFSNVTFDTTWQPLSSISIVTTGNPSSYTTELWEISYVILGAT